jgi:hypothetical protein
MMIGLSQYKEHLDWIAEAVGRAQMPADTSALMDGKLRRARARMADPELHIAVLGESSSGKSTLLNAFLRQRLLPSTALVTTRTTLTVRHREVAPACVFAERERLWPPASGAPGGDDETLAAALRRLLTTSAADAYPRLELTWPSPLLGEGVTIADTPGFNVDDDGHNDRAMEAVAAADLVVVVIPSTAMMSSTLSEFIAGPLRDHHDRCVFVLTKIDLVDPDERGPVLEVTEFKLRALGIKDPVVLPCVPVAVFRSASAAADDPDAVAYEEHARAFLDVEAELVAQTGEHRQSAIAATLLSLLGDLLGAVERAAAERGEQLAEARREVAGLSLPDLPAFLEAWSQEAVSDGARALAEAWDETSPQYFATSLESRLREAIEDSSVTSAAQMGKAASTEAPRYLRAEAWNAVREARVNVNHALTGSVDALAREFTVQYSTLARLADPDRAAPSVPAVPPGSVSMPDLDRVESALAGLGNELTGSAVLRAGGGMAIGAAIGSTITPVIGTAIGALLGGLIGKPSLQTQRTQFLARAMSILGKARDETAAAVADAVNEVFADFVGRVDAVCRAYLEEWRTDIECLTDLQERSQAALAAEIDTCFVLAETARRRHEEIVQLRGALRRRAVGVGEEL